MKCDPVQLVWQLWTDRASSDMLKAKVITMIAAVVGLNLTVWALLLIATVEYPYFFTSGTYYLLYHFDRIKKKKNNHIQTCSDSCVPRSVGVGIWFATRNGC